MTYSRRLLISIVATASITGVAGVILTNGQPPVGPTVARAQQDHQDAGESHDESGQQQAGHDSEGPSGVIQLTEAQADNLNIRVESLETGSAQAMLDRPASVHWAKDNIARVGPRITAKVESVKVDLGDEIEKGQVLAVMSSVKLGRAKAAYLAAKARLATNEATFERQQTLREKDIASEATLLEAKAAFHEARAKLNAARETLRVLGVNKSEIADIEAGSEEPLSMFRLRSPAAGTVQQRDLVVGDTVSGNDTPIHIVDVSEMWIMVDAYDRDIPLLSKGRSVTFQSRGMSDKVFTGKVDWISRALDEGTRTVRIRAVMDNPDALLKAGMYGTAEVQTNAERHEAVLAPLDAIQQVHGQSVVFVPGNKSNAYRPVPVTMGQESEQWAEVTQGVKPGQSVVTNGAFDLKAAFTAKSRSASHGH